MAYYKHKKKAHTRAESERRDNVTAIRYSDNEKKKIQENAKAAKMSINSYIVTTAANGGNGLTPADLVNIQNLINFACGTVEETAPEKIATMQEGMNKLWQKLI